MLKAHHIRPTRRPVLHIAQVRLLIELHMAATARQEEHPRDLCCYQTGLLEKLVSVLLPSFLSALYNAQDQGRVSTGLFTSPALM